MTRATRVYLKLNTLSEQQQQEVLEFVENLPVTPKVPLIDPYGTCADLRTNLSFEEFKKNRQEMWGNATDKETE